MSPKLADVKEKLTYYFWKAIIFKGYLLVVIFGPVLTAIVRFILQYVIKYRKKVIHRNFEITGITAAQDINALTRNFYKQLSIYFTEIVFGMVAPYHSIDKKVIYSGLDHIDKAIAGGKHVIILASHLGNWEWAGLLLARKVKYPVTAVYKPLSNKALDKVMYEARNRFDVQLAPMAEVIKKIRLSPSPGAFMLISDQSPASIDGSIEASFFGIETPFFGGPEKLSKKYDMAVVYQQIKPLGKGRYSINYLPVESREVTNEYAGMLEEDIRKHPAYWLWSHKRWKLIK
ncbi:MAG: lysophospholipid acyltransferase family protein [Saprospiraceae bacterium]|nr:lysophospholipid acyltransferase family protein [Saprospiraceae bacterium]